MVPTPLIKQVVQHRSLVPLMLNSFATMEHAALNWFRAPFLPLVVAVSIVAQMVLVL